MKSRKELLKIKLREKKRESRIKAFLKENEGTYYTYDEVVKKTGIKCAHKILIGVCNNPLMPKCINWWSTKRYRFGYEYIKTTSKDMDYCEDTYYFGYVDERPKPTKQVI